MDDRTFTVRTMTRAELDYAVDWAAREGWNPGLHDADCFYAADPGGFFIGLLGDEPIGSISAVKYDDHFGFIGCYIVKPEHRGGRYGLALADAALAYLKGCNIGLDGVVNKVSYYGKVGFNYAYGNVRYQGQGGGETLPEDAADILPLSAIAFAELAAYDRELFPAPREAFLRCWTQMPGATALGLRRQGRLAGYGVIRPCREGYKIGPLFADHPDHAEALFRALKATTTPDDTVYLDVPELNLFAVALADLRGMSVVFRTARMYSGAAPEIDLQRVYGVTSFELG